MLVQRTKWLIWNVLIGYLEIIDSKYAFIIQIYQVITSRSKGIHEKCINAKLDSLRTIKYTYMIHQGHFFILAIPFGWTIINVVFHFGKVVFGVRTSVYYTDHL